MMEKSAIANIQNAQASIEASLSESVRNISLQLSHLVFVNNGEIMELVSGMDTDDKEQRYDLSSRLDEIFRVSMVPSQDLSLIHILQAFQGDFPCQHQSVKLIQDRKLLIGQGALQGLVNQVMLHLGPGVHKDGCHLDFNAGLDILCLLYTSRCV